MIAALGGVMRMGRITAGIVAAGIGAAAATFVGMALAQLDHAVSVKLIAFTFLAVACAVLWVGDRFGIISEPYRRSVVVDIYGRDDGDSTPVSPDGKSSGRTLK
jgi:hypothetical protein